MTAQKILFLLLFAGCIFFITLENLHSAIQPEKTYQDFSYKLIDISSLTRYTEDRIVFQQIQAPGIISTDRDNSAAGLLIIRNNEVYLLRDGYDDAGKVKFGSYIQEMMQEMPKDLWINKINSRPDYLIITDRRTEKLLNVTEDYVEKNCGDIYRNVRNSFINMHVQTFRELMRSRTDSDFNIERKPIPQPAFQELKNEFKLTTVVKARAKNGVRYFAEDRDGDDITETFYVTFEDGFNWGYKSGPNIIFILNNKEEDIKQLIGRLCYEAYYGTSEEEKNILKTFPKEPDILNLFKLEKISLQMSQQEKQVPPADKK